MRLLKFSDTSLADRIRFREASRLVRAAAAETRVVLVASAMAGVTKCLDRLAETAGDRDFNWTDVDGVLAGPPRLAPGGSSSSRGRASMPEPAPE